MFFPETHLCDLARTARGIPALLLPPSTQRRAILQRFWLGSHLEVANVVVGGWLDTMMIFPPEGFYRSQSVHRDKAGGGTAWQQCDGKPWCALRMCPSASLFGRNFHLKSHIFKEFWGSGRRQNHLYVCFVHGASK